MRGYVDAGYQGLCRVEEGLEELGWWRGMELSCWVWGAEGDVLEGGASAENQSMTRGKEGWDRGRGEWRHDGEAGCGF